MVLKPWNKWTLVDFAALNMLLWPRSQTSDGETENTVQKVDGNIPAMPRSSNLCTSLRALLKFPYPVSASSRTGMSVASAMNSATSKIWVHEASLLSLTPIWAEMESPLPHMPANPAILGYFQKKTMYATCVENNSTGSSQWLTTLRIGWDHVEVMLYTCTRI